MKRRRIILSLGGGVLALGALILCSPESAKVDVCFWHHTNDHDVVFSMTNLSTAPVCYWVGLPQVNTNGVWSREQITPNDGPLPPASVLEPGGVAKFVVEAPLDRAEWRLPVFWQVQGKGKNIARIIEHNLRVLQMWWAHRHTTPYPGLRFPMSEVRITFSDTITK